MYKTVIAAAALVLSQVAGAAALIGSTTGLVAPATTITFDEQALAVYSAVTNQFAPQGITFSPYLYYTPQTGFPNVTGNTVGNFNTGNPDPTVLTMGFTNLQNDVAFAMVSNGTSWTFDALLSGNVQETFTTFVGSGSNNFYGFTGLTMDAIRITSNGPDYMLMDNVQLSNVGGQVPEPTSLALVALALLGAGAVARRRQA